MSRYSSTRSCRASASTSCALPFTRMSPSPCSFSFATSSAKSPAESTVEFDHSGFSSVEDTTYFGIVLNLSAKSPVREGQAAAKPS
jgi:hypothetical protein